MLAVGFALAVAVPAGAVETDLAKRSRAIRMWPRPRRRTTAVTEWA
jgi:hypothetical protein